MRESRRGLLWTTFYVAIVLNAMSISACADHGREIRPSSWQQDATINDTFWVDDQFGWAVGEQGIILRTIDGGDSWLTSQGAGLDLDDQRSLHQKLSRMRPISRTHELVPLTCSFKSVYFLDRNRGWVVGNYYMPYLKTSRSVLLATDDGGLTWKQLKGSILPEINRIYFQQALGGWALGRSGHLFKTGVFATSSGGRIWTVQDSDTPGNWVDGDLTAKGFVVIDDDGNLGRITGGKYEPSVVFGDRPGQMRSIRMLDAEIGWAVGGAGTVLQTKDGGLSWRRPKTDAVTKAFSDFDFNSVAIVGKHVFFAGNPGTIVFRLNAESADGLTQQATHFSLPVNRLFFSSVDHGCLVGDNGLIATTNSGGEEWAVKRSVDERIAVLAVTNQPDDLPLASMANYACEQNRLVGNVILGQHDEVDIAHANTALRRIGVGASIVLRGDNTSEEQRSVDEERLLSELVRTIRTLRPNVLVCGQSNSELELICRTAIAQAATEEALPSQMTNTGLTTWQVDRFIAKRNAPTGQLQFDVNKYMPRSGRLLEDQIAISLGDLGKSPIYLDSEFYAVDSFTGSVSIRGNDVFFGLTQLGGLVPERTEPTKLGNLNSIATAPLKHGEMARILELGHGDTDARAQAQSQIKNFGATQSSRESGIWLMQLAEKFLVSGNLEMAAYSMEQLVNRHADHSFAAAALMWLTQYYASDEVTATLFANHQEQAQTPPKASDVEQASIETELDDSELMRASSIPVVGERDGVREVSWEPEPDVETNPKAVPARMDSKSIETVQSWRIKTASHYLERLKQANLDFAQSPDIQYMEAMLSRKIPGDISNRNLLKKIKRTNDSGLGFRSAAGRELKTANKNLQKQFLASSWAPERPMLDGNLDDTLWQQAMENGHAKFKPVFDPKSNKPLRTDVCWIANDDEFLFIAARCNRLDNQAVWQSPPRRTRDPDLNRVERIQLRFDFDRDLRSVFQFEIDSGGRAAESCCGSVGWNPNWFVATAQDEDAWTIEIAIPVSELMAESIDESTIAAFSIGRLDANSVDRWVEDKQPNSQRKSQPVAHGIVAGLHVEPHKYQLLKFAVDPSTIDESEK